MKKTMRKKHRIALAMNSLLRKIGLEVVNSGHIKPWVKLDSDIVHAPVSHDPALDLNNPRLTELRERYAACDKAVTTPLIWRPEIVSQIDLKSFRGSKEYLSQIRGENDHTSYVATYYYLKNNDPKGLLQILKEPYDFGVFALKVDGKWISRDLLDSISEIYFLDRHLGLSNCDAFSVLDIGAGYGRLACHLTKAMPNCEGYYCTDAVPESSFLCEYFIAHRGAEERAHVVPLDELTEQPDMVDLAINIHSFPECTLEAIGWWMDVISEKRPTHLFVVPNAIDTGGRALKNGAKQEFLNIIEKRGYRLKVREPKYQDIALQEYGLSPTHYFLFERTLGEV
jgi:hypothetical protein